MWPNKCRTPVTTSYTGLSLWQLAEVQQKPPAMVSVTPLSMCDRRGFKWYACMCIYIYIISICLIDLSIFLSIFLSISLSVLYVYMRACDVCIYIYVKTYIYMCVWQTLKNNVYKFKVYTVLIWKTFDHIAKLQKYFLRSWLCVKVFVDVTEILLGVAGDGQGTKIGNKT